MKNKTIAKNIFSDIPDKLNGELIEKLIGKQHIRIERIVSRGHTSSRWYDQNKNEFVILLKGQAKLIFEKQDKPVNLKVGDYLVIPAHARHKVVWTHPRKDTIWFAVHYNE